MYNKQFFDLFTKDLKLVIDDFDAHGFVSQVMDDEWEGRELKQRWIHITSILKKFLPADYKEAIAKILELLDHVKSTRPDFSVIDDTKFGLMLEYGVILNNYVEQYGLDDYETSVKAIEKITQFTSCEFVTHPFIIKYPDKIAILLALFTKEVYLSLFAGCALGALLVAEFHPWVAFDTLFNTMIDSVDFSILMFMILLGMVVMLMQESGGTRAYGEWAAKKLKSKRATLVATSLLGALIFVDDYFNCLTVGSVMRPVTDKYKVSRAKLAYLIDATAAPVCIIAPISSWAAAVNSYVPAGSSMSGFEMFVRTIPFNLYAMLTLYMVFFTSLLGFDFGLMKKHERNAAHGDLFTSGGEAFQNQEIKDPTEGGKFAKGKVIDLIAPMIVMIFTAIATMIWTGYLNGGTNLVEDFANCSSSESLVFAGLVTVGFLLLFYLPRRVIGFKDFMNSVPEGGKLMMPPILILVLAWTLKGMTDALGIGDFVRQAVSLNEGLMRFVPLLIFCIAIFIAFSSGTSWGTFAILVPIVVNMFSETDPTMMIVAVSAVLAGAVCGDHISPISDTTIMSSSGAQSNHINHVQTQMQYAMVVVAACVPGYLIAGFTENWLITLVSSLAILTAALLYLRRRSLAEDARA